MQTACCHPSQHHVRITIANVTSHEFFQTAVRLEWDGKDERLCKAFEQAWYEEQRSAILLVPSMVAQVERNILINPAHPDTTGLAINCGSRLVGRAAL
ncbi:RES domain-containing protein [Sphingobium sp. B2]|uniref:RES domain-containing protein n=1 Tax=Sphingobium sp. B2 TaxID=2583228 RepID=UPI0011A64C23|nr:RES domain-containing protein [Sphingobium sp. B2]